MIKTSYYAKTKEVVEMGFVPIAISLCEPKWWCYPVCRGLAPSENILRCYQNGQYSEKDYETHYIDLLKRRYGDSREIAPNRIKDDILKSIHVDLRERGEIAIPKPKDDIKVCLMCYESPEKFCHRKLLHGILNCDELKFDKYEEE